MEPSDFYRKLRPENFSDSTINTNIKLAKEIAEFELSQISTNQKENQFETLARLLAEKCICPNLIPQTGPSGGGDGKTDSETHSVSNEITDRWFIPQNWTNDQQWAFAISAKTERKSKLLSDIKKIIGTQRGYQQIFFITNQKVSSKKRKDTQDEYQKQFNIKITILDGNRIIENIYNKDHLDIFVTALGLSSSLNESTKVLGSKDYEREKELTEIENNIKDTNRYSIDDFQLGEECLNAVILSRMLELPKLEIIGKIERAKSIAVKIGNQNQLIRTYYQSARTFIQYFNDYELFFKEYKNFKEYIVKSFDMDELEKRSTLLTLCFTLEKIIDFKQYGFDFDKELGDLKLKLESISNDQTKPASSITAKAYLILFELQESLFSKGNIQDEIFDKLLKIIEQAKHHLSFPMNMIIDMVNVIGSLPINSKKFDNLIDNIATTTQERQGDLASSMVYLKRGEQKLSSGEDKDAIIWFGRCIARLSKEESEKDLMYVLVLIGNAYRNLGLYRASHVSLVASLSIASKELIKTGQPHGIELPILKELIYNELIGLGRIPNLLNYYLIYRGVFSKIEKEKKDIDSFNKFIQELDNFISCRLIGSNPIINNFSYLPDLLSKLDLPMSEETSLYILGYTNGLIDIGVVKSNEEVDERYSKIASQPFLQQIAYDTNFLNGDILFHSKIIGLNININLYNYFDYIPIVELFLAYLESFFATSIMEIVPTKEDIDIRFIISKESKKKLIINHIKGAYELLYNPEIPFTEMDESMIQIIGQLLADNFYIKDVSKYLLKIMQNEEVSYRTVLIANHPILKNNFFGKDGDYSIDSLIKDTEAKCYEPKREKLLLKKHEFEFKNDSINDTITHQNIQVKSIINNQLWDQAGRSGVGFAKVPYTNENFFIILFKDIKYGGNIFDERIDKIGSNIDKDDLIRIAIIKGIDEGHPEYYKVNIGSNLDENLLKNKGGFQISPSRIHTMTPKNLNNLSAFLGEYEETGTYYLIPGAFDVETGNLIPHFDKKIEKKKIIVKEKKDIGEHDIDIVAIRNKDF